MTWRRSSERRTHRSKRGVSLIETVIAIVLLSVAVPPMVWAMQEAHHQRVDPVMISRAQILASNTLEGVLADRHAPSFGYANLTTAAYAGQTTAEGFPGFTRTVTITETGPPPDFVPNAGGGYKIVTVTVNWNDGRGEARSLVLGTVLTEIES